MIAEALGRQVALAAGKPASFDGAAERDDRQAGRARAAGGRDQPGRRAAGCPRNNAISPSLLTDLLTLAAGGKQPGADRHVRRAAGGRLVGHAARPGSPRRSPNQAGQGLVRAKTGTLSGVNTISGAAGRPRTAGCWSSRSWPTAPATRSAARGRAGPDRRPAGRLRLPLRVGLRVSSGAGPGAAAGTVERMAQFVDWDLAAATAGALVKSGPAVSYDEADEVVAELRDADRRGGRARRGVHRADRAGRGRRRSGWSTARTGRRSTSPGSSR